MKKTPTPGEMLTQQMDQLLNEGTADSDASVQQFLLLGLQRLLQVMLEAETHEVLGRDRYEKTSRSAGRHSGYKPMRIQLSMGELVLRVPRIRGAAVAHERQLAALVSKNPGNLEYLLDHLFSRPWSRGEVQTLFADPETGETPLSSTLLDVLMSEMQNQYQSFQERDLSRHVIDNVFIAPVSEQWRGNARQKSALLCAWGVRHDGRTVILHFAEGDKRDVSVWRDFMKHMRARGLANPNHIFFEGSSAFLSVAREVFPRSLRYRVSLLLIPLVAIAALILMLLDVDSPLRLFFVFGFQMLIPGWAFVRLLTLREPVHEFMLAILLSLSINTIVSEIMILAHIWSAQNAMIIVVLITLCGILLEVVLNRRHRARERWACYGVGYQL